MKLNLCLPIVGVGLALLAGGAGAQNVRAPLDSPKSKFADNMANPQLLALRDQLSELVLAKYPDAKIEFLGDALVIRRRSAKFETHLLTPFDDTFPTDGTQFPADYSEFVIRLSAADGFMATGLEQNAGMKEKAYGTLDSSVYAWKSTRRKDRSFYFNDFYFNDIPMTSWVYPALERLSRAGLIGKLYQTGGSILSGKRPMTSYEAIIFVARALDNEQSQKNLANASPDLKEDFANLRIAFPTEYLAGLRAGYKKQHTQTQVLWLTFAYGKGVDTKFVADFKQTVADYAAKNSLVN